MEGDGKRGRDATSATRRHVELSTQHATREAGGANVVLVAAEPITRAGLARALADHFTVVGSTDSVSAAAQLLGSRNPALSVSVLDPGLRDGRLDEACARLLEAHPTVRGLVLLHNPTPAAVRTVVQRGARAVFDLSLTPEHLRTVLVEIQHGAVRVAPALLPHLLNQGPQGEGTSAYGGEEPLTEREHNALSLIAQGYTSKEIAGLVGVSVKSVDMAVERATRRLRAAHRAHAVAIAVRDGLVSPW